MMQYFDEAFDHEPIGTCGAFYHHYSCAVAARREHEWVPCEDNVPDMDYPSVSRHSACSWCINRDRDVNFKPVLLDRRPSKEHVHFL